MLICTWDVTEGSDDTIIFAVDDHGTTALDAATIPHLTLASTEPAGALHLKTNGYNFVSCCRNIFFLIAASYLHTELRKSCIEKEARSAALQLVKFGMQAFKFITNG